MTSRKPASIRGRRPPPPPSQPEREECRVQHKVDSFSVQAMVVKFAERSGFARREALEVAIVATELTTNVLKYGTRGTLVVETVDDPYRGRGVRVTAFDEGPPFVDFEQAFEDGSDDNGPISVSRFPGRHGIARGLGAVRRLSDNCGWAPEPLGKRVWAERWPRRR